MCSSIPLRLSAFGLLFFALALPIRAEDPISLPAPRTNAGKPLMQVLQARRTTREFSPTKLPPQVLGDLLWAAFGINRPDTAHRTAPSAMNSQELDIYLALPEALYLYEAKGHRLVPVLAGDLRLKVANQAFLKDAPAVLIFVADLPRLAKAKPDMRPFYAGIDTGYVSQNVYLFCASEGLATVVFDLNRPPLATAMKLRPEQQIMLAQAVGYPAAGTNQASAKPVHQMSPKEVEAFIRTMRQETPNLGQRVAAIARHNLGQAYSLNLLGEFPFEVHDAQPLFSIENGDCVVFTEHTYAMALASDWQTFFALLQRIRYKNGEISVTTRNHYTLADWNENNSWLVRDLTPDLDGCQSEPVREHIDRTAFFKKSFGVDLALPVQDYETLYVPAEKIAAAAPKLRNGDCVNVIRGKKGGGKYCGHVGLITVSQNGTVNFLHSTPPKSIEQPLIAYVEDQLARNVERERKGEVLFQGIKFLRLQDEPLANLLKVDGPEAPVVTGAKGLLKKAGLEPK